MKIGLFTDAFFPIISGVSLSVDTLARELTRLGHEVYIITNNHEKALPEEHIIRLGGYRLPMKGMKEYRIGKVTNKKIQEIQKLNLDIIHCHTEFTIGRLGRKVAHKMNIPVVHTYHTMYEDYVHFISKTLAYPLRIASKYYSRSFANSVDHVIFPTIKVKRTFDRYGFTKEAKIIPTGIYLDQFRKSERDEALKSELGFTNDDFIVMYLGRLSREKSLEELIRQFARIPHKNVKLLLVGDGPDRSHFEELVHKLHVNHRVTFTGMVAPQDVHKYYKIGDLFINFSITETQGLTYIEALASKTPLLVRFDDNLEGVVKQGVNGYTFKTNDEFLELFETIYSTPSVYQTIQEHADEDIERFSALNYAKNVESIYQLYFKG